VREGVALECGGERLEEGRGLALVIGSPLDDRGEAAGDLEGERFDLGGGGCGERHEVERVTVAARNEEPIGE
jgi:hypothetical protein